MQHRLMMLFLNMYDWAHGLSDYIENVTHSICTLEFINHRNLYNWFLESVKKSSSLEDLCPKQIEFGRLQLTYNVLSKRKLQQLVENNIVNGWDDPRMPTLAGLKRRGYPAEAIISFCEKIGVSNHDSIVDINLLNFEVRNVLNKNCDRMFAVLDPIKVIIENLTEDKQIDLSFRTDLMDNKYPSRILNLTKEIFIEREDFMENPSNGFFRLSINKEVRIKGAGIIKANKVEKDLKGNILTIFATWEPEDGRKIKGTIHWLSAFDAIDAEIRLYDNLFLKENPLEDKENWLCNINPNSLTVIKAKVEPSINLKTINETIQFERVGYFSIDKDSTPDKLILNKTISLKSSK